MSPGSSHKLGQQPRTGDQLVTGNLKTSIYQTRYLSPIGPNFDRSMDQTLSRSCVHVYDYQCMDAYLPIYMSAANLLEPRVYSELFRESEAAVFHHETTTKNPDYLLAGPSRMRLNIA
ncbi:hypothetical protein PoMZ_08775 [Pyricularia oryzae]|uniref:Uncharacterized protein n=1 Tax=Pyricularia oryzae TaxID=318829 RepID=A0A4P7NIG8_PYROR|nr:hypothetical protein PoMZ_08775 [Pyricularia oryzae]